MKNLLYKILIIILIAGLFILYFHKLPNTNNIVSNPHLSNNTSPKTQSNNTPSKFQSNNTSFKNQSNNNTIYLISNIPPKISYIRYQKTLIISNKSYGYYKEYVQSFNGVIMSSENITNPNNTKSIFDNITIKNVRFGYYTIQININETIRNQFNSHQINNTTYYKLYLGNNTIIWV